MLLETPPFSSYDGKGNESVTKAIVCIHFCEYCTKVRQCCIKHLGRTTLLRKKRKYTNKIKKIGRGTPREVNQSVKMIISVLGYVDTVPIDEFLTIFFLKILACENIRFSSLFAVGYVSRETSPPRRRAWRNGCFRRLENSC